MFSALAEQRKAGVVQDQESMSAVRRYRVWGRGPQRLDFWLMGLSMVLGAGTLWPPELQANVYATNLRLVGGLQPGGGGSVEIRYVLNEPATAGVQVEILQGAQPVRVFSLAGGAPGTMRGENVVLWDGRDDAGQPVCCGSYRVRVTAAAHGHGTWTQISDDFNPGNYVFAPAGIAVHRDATSPYYGRVFVANARPGPNPEFTEGDRPGILKFYADGSPVGEGSWSDGGWAWAADGSSPGELEVGDNGWLYVWDRARQQLLRFDAEVTASSLRQAWGEGNRPQPGAVMAGFGLSFWNGAMRLWMAQESVGAGPGVYLWRLDAQGVAAAGDPGVLAVSAGTGSDLTAAPVDVAAFGGWLFVAQSRLNSGDPAPRVLGFAHGTNEPVGLRTALWSIGGGDDNLRGASAVAVDPTGRYVAVAFRGVLSGGIFRGGRIVLLDALTGQWLATLPRADQAYTGVAWDAVGNLYVACWSESVWRVYSPPGSNAATTVSIQTVEVTEPSQRPVLELFRYEAGQIVLALSGRPHTTYVLEGSADLRQWSPVTTVEMGAVSRRVFTVAAPQPRQFYRARVGP